MIHEVGQAIWIDLSKIEFLYVGNGHDIDSILQIEGISYPIEMSLAKTIHQCLKQERMDSDMCAAYLNKISGNGMKN